MGRSTEPGGRGRTLALIAARPGRMRDSLQALLAAMPRIGAVDETDDGEATLDKVGVRRPALLLLDTNLSEGQVWNVLRHVKSRWPQTRCVILAENVRQRETALAAGADGVLIKGFSTAKLYVMIDELLACKAEAGRKVAATAGADSAGELDGGTG